MRRGDVLKAQARRCAQGCRDPLAMHQRQSVQNCSLGFSHTNWTKL